LAHGWAAIRHDVPVNRAVAMLVAGALAAVVGGCGSSAMPSQSKALDPSNAAAGIVVTSQSCSSSTQTGGSAAGSSERGSCDFVLSDGRRFSCAGSMFARSLPTVAGLVHAAACKPMSRLKLPAALRAVFATIARSRACLAGAGVAVSGGPVLPPQGSPSPDGELDVGNGSGSALVAFYGDPREAQRLEPGVIARIRRFGRVERHGAVTVVWIAATASLRASVRACVWR